MEGLWFLLQDSLISLRVFWIISKMEIYCITWLILKWHFKNAPADWTELTSGKGVSTLPQYTSRYAENIVVSATASEVCSMQNSDFLVWSCYNDHKYSLKKKQANNTPLQSSVTSELVTSAKNHQCEIHTRFKTNKKPHML